MFNLENALLKLAETTHKFLICIDMEGKYSYVNEAYKNKFKKDNEAILGKYVLKDVHHEDHALVIETVTKCCANTGLAHEVIIRKPTATPGVYTYSRWDFIAIANEAGAPDYIIWDQGKFLGSGKKISINVGESEEEEVDIPYPS